MGKLRDTKGLNMYLTLRRFLFATTTRFGDFWLSQSWPRRTKERTPGNARQDRERRRYEVKAQHKENPGEP